MLVPVEWLKEYTEFEISPEELAERLTMAGMEVEEIIDHQGQKVFSTYVTPNRPDLLSITGVAREVSALLHTPFNPPKPAIQESGKEATALAKVEIESPINCPRYSARVIQGVNIVESPDWMQERLKAAGLRPINNVVDATNYVLLELGQPLHAFDYDKITDHRIIVRQARPDERMVTIDEEERTLTPNMLLITDPKAPVAVAGVMGGFDSEVGPSTCNVLLESAHFNRLSIRRTARTLQMSTESSYRFERWVDPSTTIEALDRAAELITSTGGGEIARGVIDEYPGKVEPWKVSVRSDRASMVLGFPVTPDTVSDYLTRLGMSVSEPKDGSMEVVVPTFRPDIQREDDLIEEVGRLYGYEKIPVKLIVGETTQGRDSDIGGFTEQVSNILVSCGLQEVLTDTFVPPTESGNQVSLRNPLSDDLSRLREQLSLDMLSVLSYNLNRGIRDIAIFETGRIFRPTPDDSILTEKLSIAGAVTGTLWGQTWNVDRSSLEADFFLCKGIVENLLCRLGIHDVTFVATELNQLHPTRAAAIQAGDISLGTIGQISLELAQRMDIPEQTYVFELDFNELMDRSSGPGEYTALSRYPAVTRDLAVVVANDVPYRTIEGLITKAAGELLESLTLFDVYQGHPLLPGQKSMAFSIAFRSHARTLRDDEVDQKLGHIRRLLADELEASFRDT